VFSQDKYDYYDNKYELFNGACLLYTVVGHKKPNWNARIRLPSRSGYIRRSLKTTDMAEAIALGTQLYLKLRAKLDQGLPVDVPTTTQAWDEYMTYRSACGWSKSHPEQWWGRFGAKWFAAFKRLDDIHQRDIDSYFSADGFRLNFAKNNPPELVKSGDSNWRRKRWTSINQTDSPSYSYLQGEISIMRGFFTFCEDRGYIGTVPIINNPMEHKARTGSARGCFSIEQYRLLTTEIRTRCNREAFTKPFIRGGVLQKPRPNPAAKLSNERLRMWILLLSATGIRVQEARRLRWRDIKKYEKAGSEYPYFTLIDIPREIAKAKYKGRRTGREVFSFDGNVTYDRLMNRWRDYCPTPDNNSLIFPSPRAPEKPQNFTLPFRRLLKSMKGGAMLEDSDGLPLSSYSLRHFYITMRIKAGVPLPVIAKNCGHTVSTLESTYNRLLARDMVEVLANTGIQRLQRQLRLENTNDI